MFHRWPCMAPWFWSCIADLETAETQDGKVSTQGTIWQASGKVGPRLRFAEMPHVFHHLATSQLLACCHLSLECLPSTIPRPPLRPGKLPYLLGLEVVASFSASTTLIRAFITEGWNYLLLYSSISLHLELLGMWSASHPSWDFGSWHSAGHMIGTMDKWKKEETRIPWSHLWALGWISQVRISFWNKRPWSSVRWDGILFLSDRTIQTNGMAQYEISIFVTKPATLVATISQSSHRGQRVVEGQASSL